MYENKSFHTLWNTHIYHIYEWVPYSRESCHTHEKESRHTYKKSHVTHIKRSHVTHMKRSHVTHMEEKSRHRWMRLYHTNFFFSFFLTDMRDMTHCSEIIGGKGRFSQMFALSWCVTSCITHHEIHIYVIYMSEYHTRGSHVTQMKRSHVTQIKRSRVTDVWRQVVSHTMKEQTFEKVYLSRQ